ncbi:MAG: hypothetical protein DME26_09580 [Verrucomicrobia bacterium]|nr:MAG: hypothetical protein DME26_09580 [Verrucomicrobiota bacterium]
MKLLSRFLVVLAGAGIGLAIGFALRGKAAGRLAESPAIMLASPTVSQAELSRPPNRRAPVRLNDDSPLTTKLEHDLSMSSGVTRWLYWLEAIEKAQPADFPRLARLAQGNAPATRFVAARWVELHPRHLFDTIVAASTNGQGLPVAELARVLFDEWPKRDPDAAIAALNETGNGGARNWRFDVAYGLIEKDIERGFRLLSEWHVDNVGFGPRGIAAVAKWTRANPRHAAEFMLEQPDGYSFRSAMDTIGNEWSRTDPAGALAFATGKPGELGSMLATSVLKEWAGGNLDEAADWLAGTDVRTRNRLSPTFVEAWAKQDAAGALSWCEENLAGSYLAQAVGGVLTGAAEKDVAGAAGLVAAMEPSPARAEAAVAIARKWFPQLSSDQQVNPATVAWLAGLDAESVRRVVNELQWGWSTSDPKSMAAFLVASSSDQIPTHAYTILARELARKNPSEAIEWASRLPEDHGLSAGGEVFSEWRRSQPEAAMKWLNGLSTADARREPFFQSAIRGLAYDPQAAEQLAAMTGSDRAAARNVIETMSLPEDRRARLLDMLKPR